MIRTRAIAQQWHVALPLLVLAVVGGSIAGNALVETPLGRNVVSVRQLLICAALIFGVYPLLDWYPARSLMMSRNTPATRTRRALLAGAAAGAASALASGFINAGTVFLVGVSILSVSILNRLYWVLMVIVVALWISGPSQLRIESAIWDSRISFAWASLLALLSVLAYASRDLVRLHGRPARRLRSVRGREDCARQAAKWTII